MSVTPEQFLMGGGGAPSAKFDTPGASLTGQVLEYEMRQQTDPKDNSLKTWDDGRPMMQLVVTLQTTLRDPAIEDDDGRRRIYVKGNLQYAIRDAIKAVGGKGIAVGGTLTVTYTGSEAPKRPGLSGAKVYQAVWQPPAETFFNDTPTSTVPAPQAQPAPAAAQPAQVPQQQTQPDPAALQAALAALSPEQRQMMGLPA